MKAKDIKVTLAIVATVLVLSGCADALCEQCSLPATGQGSGPPEADRYASGGRTGARRMLKIAAYPGYPRCSLTREAGSQACRQVSWLPDIGAPPPSHPDLSGQWPIGEAPSGHSGATAAVFHRFPF